MPMLWQLIKLQHRLMYHRSKMQAGMIGRKRAGAGKKAVNAVFMVLMLIYGFGVLLFMFGGIFLLLLQGMSWPKDGPSYYGVVSFIAALWGIIGITSSVYMHMFQPKDNSILLPLPIPSKYVLLSRLLADYLNNLLITGAFFLLGFGIEQYVHGFNPLQLAYIIPVWLMIPVLCEFIAILLAWLFAEILSRAGRAKKLVIYLFAFGALGLYIYAIAAGEGMTELLIGATESLHTVLFTWLLPFGILGMAAMGNILALLGYIAVAAVLVWAVVSLMGMRMSAYTQNIDVTSEKRNKVDLGVQRFERRSHIVMLFQKEWRMLLQNPMLFMNCTMGLIIIPVVAFVQVLRIGSLSVDIPEEALAVIAVGMYCCPGLMQMYAGAALNLESHYIYILKVLPIDPVDIVKAKFLVAISMLVPVWLFMTVVGILLNISALYLVYGAVVGLAFLVFTVLLGLFANLLKPRFDFLSPIHALKRSFIGIALMLANSTLLAAVAFGTYFCARLRLPVLLIVPLVVTVACGALLWAFIQNVGIRRLNSINL